MPATMQKTKVRATSEEGILRSLKLNKKDKLTTADHRAIAQAARQVSKSLRKSNPTLASHLYYVSYRHMHTNGARASVK